MEDRQSFREETANNPAHKLVSIFLHKYLIYAQKNVAH